MNSNTIGKAGLLALSAVTLLAATSCTREKPAPAAAPAAEPEDANWIVERFGEELIRVDGTTVKTDALAGKKVGIYFSAHWCPPCRAFSPVLVSTYNAIKDKGKDFEIVLVSSDKDGDAMLDYMQELKMPWPAIPYDSPLRAKLGEQYGVQGIPNLVILDADGNTVTKDGTGDVMSKRADAIDAW